MQEGWKMQNISYNSYLKGAISVVVLKLVLFGKYVRNT
jgi:hypothetical protein